VLKDSFHIENLDKTTLTIAQPQRLDDHQIFLITGGAAEASIDQTSFALTANSLLLISKAQVYTFAGSQYSGNAHGNQPLPPCPGQPLSGYRLQFGDCFWQRTPISASNCKAVLFDDPAASRLFHPDSDDLETLLNTTLQEYQTPDYSNKSDVLAAYLKIIIIKIANIHSLLQKDIATYDGHLYQDFLALVRNNYTTAHDVPFFAQRLGVTTRKLAAVCRTYGAGAKEIIIEQLIAEAKRGLQFSSRSIKEIAADLGFSSPYRFSSFFKTYAHQSPMDYREQSTSPAAIPPPATTVKIHI